MAGCTTCSGEDTAIALRDDRFRQILWFALIANLVMFVVEIVASFLGRSVSLQADALDFMGDSASYAISLFVIGMGMRARAMAGLLTGLAMGAFGMWVISHAVVRALEGSVPEVVIMGPVAALALLANLTVAALLYRYRAGDANMRSIWLCSRNDVLANVGVMLAAGGVFLTSSGWPDITMACSIAGLNLSAAMDVCKQARGEVRASRIPS